MTDREKVIKGLECHAGLCSESFPYYTIQDYCVEELCKDAIALMKEQEQKLVCTKCNGQPKSVICGLCGQAVKLDG